MHKKYLILVMMWQCLFWNTLSSASQLSDFYLSKGILSLEAGEYETALSQFEAAVKEEPADANLHYFLGLTYRKLERFPEARTALERARTLDPSLGKVHFDLGVVYFKLQVLSRALEEFQAAQQVDPDHPMVYYYQGLIHYQLRQYKQAPPLFQRARELAPQLSLTAHYYAGISFFRQGLYTQAEQEFERAIATDPQSEVAQSAQAFLDTIVERERLTKKWGLFASTAIEYDDNVVLRTDGQDLGPLGISDEGDFRHTFLLQGEYTPVRTDRTKIGANYLFFQSLHYDLAQFDIQTHMLNAFASYLIEPVQLRLDYRYDFTFLGGSRFLERHSAAPSTNVVLGPSTLTSLQYQYQQINRFDDPERNGHNHAFLFNQFFLFDHKTRILRIGYTFDKENTAGDPFDFQGHRFSIGFTTPLFWKLKNNVEFSYLLRNYDNSSSGLVENKRRRERQQTYSIGFFRDVGKYFTLSFRYTGIINDANIETFEYTRNIYSLSLSMRF